MRRRRGAACASALAALALLPAGAAAAPAVDAGSLRAEVAESPWQLRFVDSAGRAVLTEAAGRGTGPTGTLGFRTPGGWWHATHVVSRLEAPGGYAAELATTDPLGRRIRLRIGRAPATPGDPLRPDAPPAGPAAEGVVALDAEVVGTGTNDVSAVGIGFAARPHERYLGFGERFNAVDQRGNTVENYVAEGPWQLEERPFLTAFIPPWGYHPRDDATYFPMPWVLSTSGYGVLVDNPETSYHRLGSDDADAWSLEVEARRLRMRVFGGPRPADALRRLTAAIGRQPPPPAPWVLGPWFHTGQENQKPPEEERRYVELLRGADAPVSAVETHLRYLPCGAARGKREAERRRTAFFHSAGLATLTYFNPEICRDYEEVYREAQRRNVLTKDQRGEDYVYIAYVGDRTPPQTPISQIDFTAPGAQAFWDGLLSEAVEDGHDGWMEDFGEYTPPDSRSANGMDGTQMHNLYPVAYHRAGYDFARRQRRPIARHVRSGWTGVAPHAQIVWGGDPTTDWGYDGLASVVTGALTMGLSGISTWGSDIGGFFSLGMRALTPELLIRWIQVGAVSGVMRTKAGGVAIPPKRRPQVWEDEIRPFWRRYAKLRTQLYPYLREADAEYRRSGLPIMRHLALVHPEDARATAVDDEFLFGPDLLVAPVLQPGAAQRRLYLPPGRWVDLWRSVAYDERSGGLRLGAARVLAGRREATLPAPLAELPLLARSGALLALLPPDVDTLAEYGGDPGVVRLSQRQGSMELLAFPRGRSRAGFNAGESLRSEEGRGRWDLRIAGARTRVYRLQASLSTLERPLRPCAVELNGARLARGAWRYDPRTGVLTARFRARSGRLTALARCSGAGSPARPRRPAGRRGAGPRFTG